MVDHTGSSGDLMPFRPVVLDGDTCTLVRLPAGTSERARGFRAQADAPATFRAYAADWRRQPFGGDEALEPIVGEYLASIGPTQAMSIVRRRVGAIVRQARLAQVPFDTGNPHVREMLRGIARKHTGDKRQAAALTTPEGAVQQGAELFDEGVPPFGVGAAKQHARKLARELPGLLPPQAQPVQNRADGFTAAQAAKPRLHEANQPLQRPAGFRVGAGDGWAGRFLLGCADLCAEGGSMSGQKGGGRRCADTTAPRGRVRCSRAASPSQSAGGGRCVLRRAWRRSLVRCRAGQGSARGCAHAGQSGPGGAGSPTSDPSAHGQLVTWVLMISSATNPHLGTAAASLNTRTTGFKLDGV